MDHVCILKRLVHGTIHDQLVIVMVNSRTDQICLFFICQSKLAEDLPGKIGALVGMIIVGAGLVALVMYLFKWLGSMQQSGNINVYKSAVGCQGKVYLTIPAARSGEGKVQITINNSVREYNAVTDGDVIKNGTAIKVTEVLNDSTLLVEELNSLII